VFYLSPQNDTAANIQQLHLSTISSLDFGTVPTVWHFLLYFHFITKSNTLPKKNKKIKRADQILPEVYGTTLNGCFTECQQFARSKSK
jgi:hypothetical protein